MKKTSAITNWGLISLLLLSLFKINTVSAQDTLSDFEVRERLQAVQHMLEQGEPNANLWWNGWLVGYGALTVGQGTVYFISDDKSLKQDMALGAATTFLGAVGQVIAPMTPGSAPDLLAELPESTEEERAKKLVEAEKLLKESALREEEGRSWQTHAIAGVVNLGSGIIVWRGFKRSIWEGAANFVLNTIMAELQIWTQPTRAMTDYEHYSKNYKVGGKLSRVKSDLSWSVAVIPAGIGLRVRF